MVYANIKPIKNASDINQASSLFQVPINLNNGSRQALYTSVLTIAWQEFNSLYCSTYYKHSTLPKQHTQNIRKLYERFF